MPLESPGIQTRERDVSFISPAAPGTHVALIGPTPKGPVEDPTLVTSYTDYLQTFGEIWDNNGTPDEYYTSYSARDYFNRGGESLLVSRVVSGIFEPAKVNGIRIDEVDAPDFAVVNAYKDGREIILVFNELLSTDNTGSQDVIGSYTFTGVTTGSGSPFTGGPTISDNYITFTIGNGAATGSNITLQYTGSDSIASARTTSANPIELTGEAIGTITVNQTLSKETPHIEKVSFTDIGEKVSLFKFEFTAPLKVNAGLTASIFDIQVTGGPDKGTALTHKTSGGGSYIFDKTLIVEVDSPRDPNKRTSEPLSIRYTQGDNNNLQNLSGVDIPNFGSVGPLTIGVETLSKGEFNNNGANKNQDENNVKIDILNVNGRDGSFTLNVLRGDSSDRRSIVLESYPNLNLDRSSNNYIAARIGDGVGYPTQISKHIRIKEQVITAPYGLIEGEYLFRDGTGKNQELINNNITSWNNSYEKAISNFNNKEEYDIDIISAPGITVESNPTLINRIRDIAEGRGDCIGVIDIADNRPDLTEPDISLERVAILAEGLNSNYLTAYHPYVRLSSATGKSIFCPPSTVVPGLLRASDLASDPWFLPAGVVRGNLPNVIDTRVKLPFDDRNILYRANVNALASRPGQNVVAWAGQTLQQEDTLLRNINVRRLLIVAKRFVEGVADSLLFEQNTVLTRASFVNAVNPFFASIQARRGLFDFKVVADETLNTPEVVDRGEFRGQIQLKPVPAIEFIILDFTVTPSGVEFA